MRALQADRVFVVREAEQRNVGEALGDVVRVDPADVGDDEIRRLDAFDRRQTVVRQGRFELPSQEEIHPDEQDPRHPRPEVYDVCSPSFAKTWSSPILSHQSLLKNRSSPSAIRTRAGGDPDRGVVRAHPAERPHRMGERDPCKQEGEAEAERVRDQEDDTAGDAAACAGDRQDRGEHRADARRRGDGEGAAEEDGRPAATRALDDARGDQPLRPREQTDEREAEHDEDEAGDRSCVFLSTVLATAAAAAPSTTKTAVNPAMNGSVAITTRRAAPRSPRRLTSTDETADR